MAYAAVCLHQGFEGALSANCCDLMYGIAGLAMQLICWLLWTGTEDVVRVYGEAATQEEADQLAQAVAMAIYETVDGTGEPPELGKWK